MQRASWEYYRAFGLPRPSRKLFALLRGPYTMAELADSLQISAAAIMNWERGHALPSPPNLRQLVDHYLMVARRYKRDPLHLLTPEARLAPPARRPRGEAVTPPAPPQTARKKDPAQPPPPPPPIPEGGEENV